MHPILALRAPKRLPFLQVLKTSVAAVGAWLLAAAAFPDARPVFATIAALLVVQPSVSQSLVRALERSAGVVLGVLVAVAGSAALGANTLTVVVVVTVAVALSWALRLSPGSGNQVAISAMLVIALGATTPGYALDRVLETLLGAAVGLVVNAAIAPPSLVGPAVTAVERLAAATAGVMERLGEALRTPRTSIELDALLADARGLRSATEAAAAALEAGSESLMLNPLRGHHRRRVEEAAAVHARLRAVVQRLVAMTRTLHDHWRPELVGDPLAAGIAQELDRVAHDLRLLSSPGAPGRDDDAPLLTEPLQVLAAPRRQWILIGSLLEDLRRMREEIVGGIEARDRDAAGVRPDGGGTVRALVGASHPVPSLTVTLVGVALAVSVGATLGAVVLVGVTLALNQLSIGWSNDWLDAGRDRVAGRADKPVATGAVAASTIRAAAIAAGLLSLVVGALVSPVAAVANAVLLGSGWAYNALLKRTPISPLPYLVGFGALPWLATGAVDAAATAWATAAGALFGLGAHLANVLPDLDADARTGVRGLPHRLPPTVVAGAAGAAVVAGALVVAVGVGGVTGVLAVVLTTVPAVLAVRSGRAAGTDPHRAGWAFRWIMAGALVLAAALVAAGPRLLV